MCFPTAPKEAAATEMLQNRANAVCVCTCVYTPAVWTQLELIHVVFDLDYPSLQGTRLVFLLLIPKPGFFFPPSLSLSCFLFLR